MKSLFLYLIVGLVLAGSINGLEEISSQLTARESKKEQTLSIIKPDAVLAKHTGAILTRLEKAGLKIVALKMVKLSLQEAEEFYAVHKDRPFFSELTIMMSRAPIVVSVLEGENAVLKNREIMGATDPAKAAPGTIRADFADSITRNAVHGSDSEENAKKEIEFFFSKEEIFSR